MVRIPLDIVATGTGHTTKGVLVGVMAADLDKLEAENRALSERCVRTRAALTWFKHRVDVSPAMRRIAEMALNDEDVSVMQAMVDVGGEAG